MLTRQRPFPWYPQGDAIIVVDTGSGDPAGDGLEPGIQGTNT
jgi:hypothetical protein